MTHKYIATPTKLQLEISSMCNALCYGCARTENANFNTKRPLIPDKKILSLAVLKKVFTQFTTVTGLDFCGTVDDPFMHPQFKEILELAYDCGIKRVWIHSNASIRPPEYWRQCAEVLKKFEHHELKFSIDGLEDTNHLYRQRTNFHRIMENAQAFIDAGGNASWQYLVFPWNSHQVDEAKQLSADMGFKTFIHRHDRSIVASQNWDIDDIKRIQTENKPTHYDNNFDITKLYEHGREYENNPIECFFQKEKMYFIDFNARLWPCCFLRNTEFFGHNNHWYQVKHNMFDAYKDVDWNRLDLYNVNDVLNHPFFANDLVESFDAEYGTGCGKKIVKCAGTCSLKGQQVRPIAAHKHEENK